MGTVSKNSNGSFIISENLEYTKDSKSKKYRVYNIDDKENGIIITVYIESKKYNDFNGKKLPVKIKV